MPMNVITVEPEGMENTVENVESSPETESTEGIAQRGNTEPTKKSGARKKGREFGSHGG